MSLRERIQRAEAANRQASQDWLERNYSQGWRPPRYRDDWKLGAAIVFLSAAIVTGLVWIQLTSLP